MCYSFVPNKRCDSIISATYVLSLRFDLYTFILFCFVPSTNHTEEERMSDHGTSGIKFKTPGSVREGDEGT